MISMLSYDDAIRLITRQMPKITSSDTNVLIAWVAEAYGRRPEEVEADVLYKLQGA